MANSSVLLNQISHGKTLETSAKHTIQNDPGQEVRELGYLYPTSASPWLTTVPRGDVKSQVPPCPGKVGFNNPRGSLPKDAVQVMGGQGRNNGYYGVHVVQQSIC